MRVWILVLLLIGLAASPSLASAQCTPPASGNWVVNETVVCSSQFITLKGDLVVNGSGNLTLQGSTLRFNATSDGQYGIRADSSLYVLGSAIRSNSTKAYTFVSNPGAVLVIRDSSVQNCGYSSTDVKRRGVYVDSDGSKITNTAFTKNYLALIIHSSGSEVQGNKIYSSQGGLSAEGSNNLIRGNLIRDMPGGMYVKGENLIIEHNVIENTSVVLSGPMHVNNSLINNNTFVNNTGGSYGFEFSGKGNNITNNRITSNDYNSGIGLYDSENTRIIGNAVLGNADMGLSLIRTKNTLVKDSTFNLSGSYDVYMLSAEGTTFNNTAYEKLVRKWRMDVRAVDGESDPVSGANVVIKNRFANTLFSGSTNSQGRISQQTPEERIENRSGVFIFNPYTIDVSRSGYVSNSTAMNVTGDVSMDIVIEALNVSGFVINVVSPENNSVHFKTDLVEGVLLPLEVESDVNLSSCNYTLETILEGSLSRTASNRFGGFLNVSGFTGGEYEMTFVCSTNTTENSTKVNFFVYPARECTSDLDCGDSEECTSNYECVEISCTCGYASNHECVYYECCDDGACEDDEFCDTGTNQCTDVECDCGVPGNHRCVFPYPGYCCENSHCDQNQSCDVINHKCVTQILHIFISGVIAQGEEIRVYVKDQNNRSIADASVAVTYAESGNLYLFSTGSSGFADIYLNESGNTQVSARKANYFTGSVSLKVPAAFNWVIFSVIFIVIFLAILVPVLLKTRHVFGLIRLGSPLNLEKTRSGEFAMLRIRNNSGDVLKLLKVVDYVPRGSFVRCNITPEIETMDSATDRLSWMILELRPKEEVTIEYQSEGFYKGFSVESGGKRYES
jgi:parallel beta-helix repeat protein